MTAWSSRKGGCYGLVYMLFTECAETPVTLDIRGVGEHNVAK